ncbi:hypothetical protein Scep_022607 [Stephania cephalantha]|uniref:Protein ABA DEFICIENT 4, chloroplastic-like n=1 Tax=Stephania cephalantha TaxID=152367 RepID=A0AAP0HXY8_9MAGN
MAASASCCPSRVLFNKVDYQWKTIQPYHTLVTDRKSGYGVGGTFAKLLRKPHGRASVMAVNGWSFIGGSKLVNPKVVKLTPKRKGPGVFASCKIASGVFTIGTVAVLPFYTFMVLAPKAKLTRKTVESTIPYVALGLLYAYLLYLSWTPETLKMMFASQYWLPELPGIAKMFSNEMTLASAWIHLLVVDLFAARQIFQDGLLNDVETRHSVSLCLLFCPIGILSHVVTKAFSKRAVNTEKSIH